MSVGATSFSTPTSVSSGTKHHVLCLPLFHVAENPEGKTEQKRVAITREILSRTWGLLPRELASFRRLWARDLQMQHFCQSPPLSHPLFL